MKYQVTLTELAKADYLRLDARWRAAVKQALEEFLAHQPDQVSKSRIKRLRGLEHPQFRLRVDNLRIFYDISGDTVEVLAILPKEEALRWLQQFTPNTP